MPELPHLNPDDYESANDKLACAILNQLGVEPAGKVYAKAIDQLPNGTTLFSGILQMGQIVTRVSFAYQRDTLRGSIDEPGTARLERQTWEKAVADTGLSAEEVTAAAREIRGAIQATQSPQVVSVHVEDIEAASKCLRSGLHNEAALILKRLLPA